MRPALSGKSGMRDIGHELQLAELRLLRHRARCRDRRNPHWVIRAKRPAEMNLEASRMRATSCVALSSSLDLVDTRPSTTTVSSEPHSAQQRIPSGGRHTREAGV